MSFSCFELKESKSRKEEIFNPEMYLNRIGRTSLIILIPKEKQIKFSISVV